MRNFNYGWSELNRIKWEHGDSEIGLVGVLACIAYGIFMFWALRLFLIYGCMIQGACTLH